MMAKISFFVAGLKCPAILHHQRQPAGEMQFLQQALHYRRQHLGRSHLSAEFHERPLLAKPIPNAICLYPIEADVSYINGAIV
jgi:hypothetical protein